MTPPRRIFRHDREGIALLVVLLVTLTVAAIAAGAALIGANSFLINEYDQRISLLESVADAGLEYNRARLNANPSLFPADTGFATLEENAAVHDAHGNVIPGVTRAVYAGPIGGGPGEFGSFGMLISVASDGDGARAIRRQDLLQSSFARYAYFTDNEPSDIWFGSGDQLYGPVHSNANIKIRSSGATFHQDVTTSGVFEGAEYATFKGDTITGVTPILMPSSSQLSRLKDRAAPGHLDITGSTSGTAGQATVRIEFVSKDVDGDGVHEGFLRVYRHTDPVWVTGNVPAGGMLDAENCGHFHSDGLFYQHVGDDSYQLTALESSSRRCYLGGADSLWQDTLVVSPDVEGGTWDQFPGTVHATLAARQDGPFLFPLDRRFNPGYRGVVYVDGKVVVSGRVRGRLTLAATGNIIIADDLRYQTDPGGGSCTDVLGLYSGGRIYIADNMLNTPQSPGSSFYTYDETRDEYIHASMLAMDQILVEDHDLGPTTQEPCGMMSWGRGCLFITGGLIQSTRGPVGTTSGTGYVKRYTHDVCAAQSPPPYFPTTGHFWPSRYYEVDPTGFDVGAYFRSLN